MDVGWGFDGIGRRRSRRHPDSARDHDPVDQVRIDNWLWAARLFETRNAATAAVLGGRVPPRETPPGAGTTLRQRRLQISPKPGW